VPPSTNNDHNQQQALDHRHQIDLDFSKAFDTVPHQRLLKKLVSRATFWLTQKSKRVVIDGDHLEFLHVESGVPQGTVLGPIMFLLYINDIGEVSSSIRLFADDCVVYRIIKSVEDHDILQADINTIPAWSKTWQMRFNIAMLHCSRSPTPSLFTYQIDGCDLCNVKQHTYLGITLTSAINSCKQHMF